MMKLLISLLAMLLLAVPASAGKKTDDPTPKVRVDHWWESQISVYDYSDVTWKDRVSEATRIWSNATRLRLVYEDRGTLPCGDVAWVTGAIVVCSQSGGVGLSLGDRRLGNERYRIVAGYVTLNENEQTWSNIAVHEMGHSLGFNHPSEYPDPCEPPAQMCNVRRDSPELLQGDYQLIATYGYSP